MIPICLSRQKRKAWIQFLLKHKSSWKHAIKLYCLPIHTPWLIIQHMPSTWFLAHVWSFRPPAPLFETAYKTAVCFSSFIRFISCSRPRLLFLVPISLWQGLSTVTHLLTWVLPNALDYFIFFQGTCVCTVHVQVHTTKAWEYLNYKQLDTCNVFFHSVIKIQLCYIMIVTWWGIILA